MRRGGADFNKNNLDCLRLILASIVVVYHTSAITALPAYRLFELYTPRHFAIKAFFIISGLLIYRSYQRSSSIKSYFDKRARRIYPAYIVVIVLAALSLWTLSSAPLHEYFGLGFWKYLAANLVFLNFLAPTLPGVFTSNFSTAVNGALWTLKIEVAFYLLVPIIHYLSARFGAKKTMVTLFGLSCLWKYGFAYLARTQTAHAVYGLDPSRNIYRALEAQFPAQLGYFVAGILVLLYFDKLKLYFAPIAAITLCLLALDLYLTGEYLDIFWIPGLVLTFGFWRYFGHFAKYGDFSYGVYIVHWPIIQVLITLGLLRLNPWVFFAITFALVGVAGILMWRLVERRFLTASSHYKQVADVASA